MFFSTEATKFLDFQPPEGDMETQLR